MDKGCGSIWVTHLGSGTIRLRVIISVLKFTSDISSIRHQDYWDVFLVSRTCVAAFPLHSISVDLSLSVGYRPDRADLRNNSNVVNPSHHELTPQQYWTPILTLSPSSRLTRDPLPPRSPLYTHTHTSSSLPDYTRLLNSTSTPVQRGPLYTCPRNEGSCRTDQNVEYESVDTLSVAVECGQG